MCIFNNDIPEHCHNFDYRVYYEGYYVTALIKKSDGTLEIDKREPWFGNECFLWDEAQAKSIESTIKERYPDHRVQIQNRSFIHF